MANNALSGETGDNKREPTKDHVFNRETGIVGYTFGDGTKFKVGPTYSLTEEEAKRYAEHKIDGHKLLVVKKA